MYHLVTDLAWNLPGYIIYEYMHRRRKKWTQRGKGTSKYTETITQVNITSLLEFHLARVKLCSYLQLTGRLQNSRFYLFIYLFIYRFVQSTGERTMGHVVPYLVHPPNISKEIGNAWRKSLTRAMRASLTRRAGDGESRSLFSPSFQTYCWTARAYLNTQKYGLFWSLTYKHGPGQPRDTTPYVVKVERRT